MSDQRTATRIAYLKLTDFSFLSCFLFFTYNINVIMLVVMVHFENTNKKIISFLSIFLGS